MRPLLLLLLLLVVPLPAGAQGSDPAELERTWQAAWAFLPGSALGYRRPATADLSALLEAEPAPLPVVVYGHGCTGLDAASAETGRFLARAGFLVVAPDSFARADKPRSCDPSGPRGGLHREVLGWRQAELAYALEQVRALPGLRPDAVFLMGFSEGGITVATLEGVEVAGRVVEGWTCHAGWPEYRGLRAPPEQPVLALVARDDPWFRLPVLRGDCGAFMVGRTGSRSLVYDDPNLRSRHWLTGQPAVQAEVVAFLTALAAP